MPSTFFGLNTALSGLVAQQRALDTTNHNLANVNTEGYSRQRVSTQASLAYAQPALNTAVGKGQLGTGVEVQQYTRLRDQFVDLQYRSQNAAAGQYQARNDALEQLNQVVAEPSDTGITALLGNFWGSWQSLTQAPESASVRESVRSAGEQLATGIKDMRANFVSAQNELTTRIGADANDVNLLAGQVNELNQSIAKVVAVGQQPNDLQDQRDLLIDKISKIGNLTLTPVGTTGALTLAFGGQVLVNGATNTVNNVAVDAAGNVTVGGNAATVSDGSLRGEIDVRDTSIGGANGYLTKLDTLAATLITQINTRHAAGFALDGTTGNTFFQGTDASNIAISAAVQGSTDKIAASGTAADVPGGNAAALNLAQLKDVALPIGTATTNMDGYWASVVSGLGVDADRAGRLLQVQNNVLQVAAGRRDSTSGVSIDEEVTDMVRYQQSYNASARMMTTLDGILDTIVNRMGTVGR
ncbi:MAG: flagellar hook-associated protein FlgK [Thermoleophilia bacterium]|mgnify:CR=1 FL=1